MGCIVSCIGAYCFSGRSPRPVPRHGRAHAGHDGGGDGGGGAEGRRGASTFWRGGIGVGGMLGLGGMLTAWVGSGVRVRVGIHAWVGAWVC